MKYRTNNLKEFNQVAEDFAKKIPALVSLKTSSEKEAKIIALYGDLGAGKTHFVKACAKILGSKAKINSPTFVIMKRYKNIYHIDAYRLKNEKELLSLGWAEIIKNPENIIFIEWPENVKKNIPKKHFKIKIKHLEGEKRKIEIR